MKMFFLTLALLFSIESAHANLICRKNQSAHALYINDLPENALSVHFILSRIGIFFNGVFTSTANSFMTKTDLYSLAQVPTDDQYTQALPGGTLEIKTINHIARPFCGRAGCDSSDFESSSISATLKFEGQVHEFSCQKVD